MTRELEIKHFTSEPQTFQNVSKQDMSKIDTKHTKPKLYKLTGVMSEMPWKKSGTLGSVTVMEEASPEPGAPGPTAPIKEPKSCATFVSGLPSAG